MKQKINLGFVFLVILICNFNLSLSGSSQEKKKPEPLQHEVSVVLKLIQVYVTDKDGNPVTDLEKSDFILHDNGKLREVTDLEKHTFSKPKKDIAAIEQKDKVEKSPAYASTMNRKFFLLLDFYRNNVRGISKSKKAAQHFINTQIRPTDEVGILIYSKMRGIILQQYLTSDHQKISEALKQIRGVPAEAGIPISQGARSMDSSTPFSQNAPPELAFEKMKTRQFASELSDFAKSLQYIPGYKNVVLFSAGVPRYLIYESSDSGVRDKIEQTAKDLASSNVPIFSINADGARAYSKNENARGDHSLKILSDLSGGKYYNEVDNYESIANDLQNVTSNYYVLGYYINEAWDGKYHDIKVAVNRNDCIVKAQAGYFNPKPFTEFDEYEKLLHLIDLAFGEKGYYQESIQFPLEALICSVEEKSNLVLISKIDLEETKAVVTGKTEVYSLIADQNNNLVEFKKGILDISNLSLPNIYPYRIAAITPGKYECRIILRNPKTGYGAVASSPVLIPNNSKNKLDSSLFLIPNRTANYINISSTENKESGKQGLSISDLYPFVSIQHSPLAAELWRGTKTLLAIIRSSTIDFSNQNVDLSAEITELESKQKEVLLLSVISPQRKVKNINTIIIELMLPVLASGKYAITLCVSDLEKARKYFDTRKFIVK